MSSSKYDWILGQQPPLLEAHSAAKHAVFRSYVARYIEVLTSNPRREALGLTLVDGFAGGGQYLFEGCLVPGSPMILLQEVACARARLDLGRRKPFKLNADFIFVERLSTNKDFLEDIVRQSEYRALLGSSLHIINAEFEQALPSIIASIRAKSRSHRSLFFLDQYGYGQVSLATIRTILSSLENPEIIVTFNVDWLINYLSEKEEFLKAIKPVELGMDAVRQMLALKGQREGRWLIQNLLFRHLRDQTGAPYYTCFFIKSPASHRSYWLVHISKHPKARDEMALRHWAMSNHFVHHGGAGLRMLGFHPEQDPRQVPLDFLFDDNAEERSRVALMEQIPPLIFEGFAGHSGPPTLKALFSHVCNETPATTKQIGKILVALRDEKEIEIVTSEGRTKPRSGQLDWDDVILPARQRSLLSQIWPLK
jgi:three-Cys-motif partner protein